ncbi:hypothetical protein BC567DRAFT_92636 [Phyllosticta citribraziliensis]
MSPTRRFADPRDVHQTPGLALDSSHRPTERRPPNTTASAPVHLAITTLDCCSASSCRTSRPLSNPTAVASPCFAQRAQFNNTHLLPGSTSSVPVARSLYIPRQPASGLAPNAITRLGLVRAHRRVSSVQGEAGTRSLRRTGVIRIRGRCCRRRRFGKRICGPSAFLPCGGAVSAVHCSCAQVLASATPPSQ